MHLFAIDGTYKKQYNYIKGNGTYDKSDKGENSKTNKQTNTNEEKNV